MFTVPPSCRLGQPGYEATCVMCRKVLYDDEDEEAPDEEMMECQDCADFVMANQQDLNQGSRRRAGARAAATTDMIWLVGGLCGGRWPNG